MGRITDNSLETVYSQSNNNESYIKIISIEKILYDKRKVFSVCYLKRQEAMSHTCSHVIKHSQKKTFSSNLEAQ